MRILLVKPHPQLLVPKRLQQSFLHLEPLELEIVAGGVPEEDEVRICDLSLEKKPIDAFWWHFGGWVEVKSAEICMVRQRRVCSEARSHRHEATLGLGGSRGMPPENL